MVTGAERHFRPLRIAAALALVLALGGCAGLGAKAPPTFDLSAANAFPTSAGGLRGQLIVNEPTALAILDSEKIVARPAQGELGYLGGAQWIDRLPKLLQVRLVQSFENANRLKRVGMPGARLAADFSLVTDVRAFQIALADNGAFAEVEISAKIVVEKSGRIIAGRIFRATVPAPSGQPQAVALALDEAFRRVAVDLVLWAARGV